MAKKNKNEITADELIGKLGQNRNTDENNENPFAGRVVSIDLTSSEDKESDSDLDISELMKKYLPELDDWEKTPAASEDDVIFDIGESDSQAERDVVRLDGRFSSDPLDEIGELSDGAERKGVKNGFDMLGEIGEIGDFSEPTDRKETQQMSIDGLTEFADEPDNAADLPDITEEPEDNQDELVGLFEENRTGTGDDDRNAVSDESLLFGGKTDTEEPEKNEEPEQIFMPFANGIFSEYEIDSEEARSDASDDVKDARDSAEADDAVVSKQKKKEADDSGVIESKRTRRFLDSLLKRTSSRLTEESEPLTEAEEKKPFFDDKSDEAEEQDDRFEFADERNIDDSFDEKSGPVFVDSREVDDSFDEEWDDDTDVNETAEKSDAESTGDYPEDESLPESEAEASDPFAALFGSGDETVRENDSDGAFAEADDLLPEETEEFLPENTPRNEIKFEDDRLTDAEFDSGENELIGAESLFAFDECSMTEAVSEEDSPEKEIDGTDEGNDGIDETGETVPVDPTDINLMIAFDMDSSDDVTAAQAKELGDKLEAKQNSRPARKFVLDRPEYVDKSQTQEIRKEFKKKKTSLTVRTLICAVFSVILFVFENITSLTQLFTGRAQQFAGAFDPALYPVVYIMVSLQLMLLTCLCALPEILDGLKYLFMGTPKPSSMTGVLAGTGIIYSAVLCNLIKSPEEPVMLNFVVAMSTFLTLVCEILNNKREMMNFRIIAGKKVKHVVRKMQEEESERETEAFAGEEETCDVMKIEKTDFVDNFFTRLRTPNQSTGTTMTFIMCVAVAAGILFGIFTSLRSSGDKVSAWRSVFSAMYLLTPMSVYLAFSYPFFRANRIAKEYDSTIIGEASLEEYSNASIISFDDKNVFPSYSVKVQNIRIYNNARIDRVLYYASSVFSYAGGPLQDVFEIATKDMGTSSNVKIFDTEAGFLATQVDGVNIIFGSYDALTSRGLEIPDNAAEDDVDLSDELSIMYMFRESKLVAKMYIKYDMDEDIDVILKQFAGDGLYVCVRTFDPNIDEMMIAKKLNVKRVPLKIIRYSNPDEVGRFEAKVDSGLVTNASPKSLLQVISYCEKVIHTKKTNVALAVLSLMIGAALLLLLLLAGSTNILTSFLIAIYQLVWLVPALIASRIFIR